MLLQGASDHMHLQGVCYHMHLQGVCDLAPCHLYSGFGLVSDAIKAIRKKVKFDASRAWIKEAIDFLNSMKAICNMLIMCRRGTTNIKIV